MLLLKWQPCQMAENAKGNLATGGSCGGFSSYSRERRGREELNEGVWKAVEFRQGSGA